MNKILTTVCLFISQVSFSQIRYQPTQFDKFISKSDIEWAAYASDTFNFSKAGLNALLLNRLKKDDIKASIAVLSRTNDANNIKYLKSDEILSTYHFSGGPIPIYDSLGNVIEVKDTIPKIDVLKFRFTEITQIIYIEKGILKSYIPLVSPAISIFTVSSKQYVGESFYFSTAFNYKYNYKPHKRDKIVYLRKTSKELKFIDDVDNNLKELYGNNLIETLWPYVLNGKIELYNTKYGNKINPTSLNTTQLYSSPVFTPVYDSVNVVSKYETVIRSVNPKDFTHVVLVQDWYYNESKNIVFNQIKEMYLYVTKELNEPNTQPKPILKLVFK